METIERRTIRTLGKVTVIVKHILDESPDVSWLGEYCNYRAPANVNQKLVHRDSGCVLDHHGIWRDERGRVVAAPEDSRHSREFQYTWHDNGHEKLVYALQDSRRLEGLNRGDWCMLGIVATVCWDGVKVGEASIWGVESDSPDYIATVEREEAWEAIKGARRWYAERVAS